MKIKKSNRKFRPSKKFNITITEKAKISLKNNEQITLIDQSKIRLEEVLVTTNKFFELDWLNYQTEIEKIKLSPFKEIKILKTNQIHYYEKFNTHFIKPFYYITERLAGSVKNFAKSLDFLRVLIAGLKQKLNKILAYIYSRLFNVIVPLQKIIIKFKDLLQKISGAVVAGLYTVYGLYMAMKSFVGAFLHILIIALVVILALIVLLWILPFTWPAAASGTVFFSILSIPIVITAGWMKHILDINSRRVPKRKCFDKNTIILFQKNKKLFEIKNIRGRQNIYCRPNI